MITQIKDKLKKVKPAFSFFKFYYHVIRKSPKQYDMLNKKQSHFFISITPFIFFLITLFITFFMPVGAVLFLYLWIPVILANLFFMRHVDMKGRKIERKLREEREELKRAEEERKYKEKMEEMNKWFNEFLKEKQKAEEARKRKERAQKTYGYSNRYEDFDYGDYSSGNQRQNQNNGQQKRTQNTRTYVDQNRINAMKLLGLKDGFTLKDLKSAYKKLSKVHHPDTPTGTEKNFIRLNTAYNYLLDRM